MPRRRRARILAVQVCRRNVRHRPCQQRGIPAGGTRQRAEMGRAEQPKPKVLNCNKSTIGVPVMVHLGGGKTKFARILGSRP